MWEYASESITILTNQLPTQIWKVMNHTIQIKNTNNE